MLLNSTKLALPISGASGLSQKVILEISGTDSVAKAEELLATRLWTVFTGREDLKVTRPTKMEEFNISGDNQHQK